MHDKTPETKEKSYIERAKQFRAKKRLGQNFLADKSVIDVLIEQTEIKSDDIIVEIGAGLGFVTEKLVEKAGHVVAIELDGDAVSVLSKIKAQNLEIINDDVLKTDFTSFVIFNSLDSTSSSKKIKIVANIPYYITTPILLHLLGEVDDLNNKNRNSISQILLMVQKEVAQRLVANEKSPSKQYGMLSILAQFFCDVQIVEDVKAKSFFPKPKVDSAVVKLIVNDKPRLELADYKFFRRVSKACFATRRKNIKNSLLAAGFLKEQIDCALKNLNIAENTRGEALSIEAIGELSKELLKSI